MHVDEQLLQALAVTAELTGTELSSAAKRVMVDDLALYPQPQVLAALVRCRRELRSRLTIADIVLRLDDGRPGPEEAWAMIPRDESATVVWTDEMTRAWGVVFRLIENGDEIGARMAFKEAYIRELTEARAEQRMVRWTASLGHDPQGRETALLEAVERGRIDIGYAKKLLPYRDNASPQMQALLEKFMTKALPENVEADDE